MLEFCVPKFPDKMLNLQRIILDKIHNLQEMKTNLLLNCSVDSLDHAISTTYIVHFIYMLNETRFTLTLRMKMLCYVCLDDSGAYHDLSRYVPMQLFQWHIANYMALFHLLHKCCFCFCHLMSKLDATVR